MQFFSDSWCFLVAPLRVKLPRETPHVIFVATRKTIVAVLPQSLSEVELDFNSWNDCCNKTLQGHVNFNLRVDVSYSIALREKKG